MTDNPGTAPRPRWGRRAAQAAAVVAVVAAVGAWAVTRSGAAAESPVGADLGKLRALPPLTALMYHPSAADQRIAEAQDALTAACMTRHGFHYTAAAPHLEPDDPEPFGLEPGRLGGSGGPSGPGASEPKPRPDSAAYGRALFGDPDNRLSAEGARLAYSRPGGGCLAEAEQRLLGTERQRWMQVRIGLFEVEEDARVALDRDPAFATATRGWQQCMREAGHPAESPAKVLDGLPRGANLRTDPAVAADLRCKAATAYLVTGYQRLAAQQSALLARDPRLAADRQRLLAKQDAVAREVLAR